MKIIVKDMVRKAPKPEDLDKAFGDDAEESTDSEEMDEDGDQAAKKSALEDFIRAIGGDTKKADQAAEYLSEFLSYCK